jgi:uncharacterized protein YbjT (DUF2867 family)
MAEGQGRTALLAGGSGMVGSHLLSLLLQASDYLRVYALSRRPLPLDHPRLANRVLNFGVSLQSQLKGLQCQDAFCCLGTTIREAGSQQEFRAVDHDLVLEFARAALSAGVERFVLVSAVGADASSRNFYLRVKGETERALMSMNIRSLDIMAPSLLLGSRRDLRPLELVARSAMWMVNPLLLGKATRYRGIAAETVAAAMVAAARSGRRGLYRYGYDEMTNLANPPVRRNARL